MWLIVNILGVLVLLWLLFKLLALLWRLLWPYVLARPKNLKQLAGDCRWALVTGCTDGIGRAYAQELASRGFSLVLVSRTAQKLEQMEQEFRRRFIKADFLSIPFDFSEPRVEEYRHRLLKHIQHLDIGILVNNVGAAHSYPQRFHDSAGGLEKTADVMTINMFPVTLLTAFVLDQMLKRGKGVVVNISSIAAYSPNFHTALYSATKCFVNWLSAGIRKDYAEHKGIIIQTICPSVVITKMSSMVSEGKKPSFLMPSAEQFARQAIRTIGHAKETCGCLSHQFLKEMISLMPQFVVDIFIKKMMLRIRANWLKNHPPF